MKRKLLDAGKSYFKANLHCHSLISDGTKTPEEIKEMYKQHGYSVVAYTDHDVLLDHSDLCDDSFIALNGYETEVSEDGEPSWQKKTYHMCFVALDQDNLTQVCYHRSRYLFGKAREYKRIFY